MVLPACNRAIAAQTCPNARRSRDVASAEDVIAEGVRDAERFVQTPPCELRRSLRKTAHCLQKRYRREPNLTWAEFSNVPEDPEMQTEDAQRAAQQANAYACVHVDESDFAHGTLIVFAPCELIFDGTVYTVSPNEDQDFRPTAAQREPLRLYSGDEYALGFFAAIAIRSHDVTLTLNRSTLQQSALFALQQRFFALIELADQPFVPGQGPADFGDELVPAENVIITNGSLGRSSHHGVHGNGARRVLLHAIDFADYEVAAVSVNGVHDFVVDQCRALGSRNDVPVGATYSAARFLVPFIDAALAIRGSDDPALAPEYDNLVAKSDVLRIAMNSTVVAVQDNLPGSIPDVFQLGNDEGLIDGNGYGFLFNVRGVAVNGFVEQLPTVEQCATNVAMFECEVRNTAAAVDQVVALREVSSGRVLTDTAGAVLPIDRIVDGDKKYVGTPLSDAQIALARLVNASALLQGTGEFSGLYVPNEIVEWAENANPASLDDIPDFATRYERIYNGDSMFHVNKGVLGVNCNGIYGLTLKNVVVDGVRNAGMAADEGNHPNQGESMVGYTGDDAVGVSLAACHRVSLCSVDISEIVAEPENGVALGVNVRGRTQNVLLKKCSTPSLRIGAEATNIALCETESAATHIEAPLSEVSVAHSRC